VSDTLELSLRGLPEWLIREYFKEMSAQLAGGDEDATGATTGDWSVSWTHQRVKILGSSGIGLTQFDLVFRGEPEVLRDVHDRFMKKAQRGGG
jgi:hypothetical protein